jgi:hypothetical protein
MSDDSGMTEERTASFDAHMAAAFAEADRVEATMRAALKDACVANARNIADVQEAEEAERQAFLERQEERRLLLKPKLLSASSIEVAYLGDELDNDLEIHELSVEAILGRKVHREKVYYKVKWRARRFVTWELESAIDNKALIEDFERAQAYRARMPPTARLRPPVYTTRRQMALNPELAARVLANQGPDDRAVWLCEVEHMVWIPYDDSEQHKLEAGHRVGAVTVNVVAGGSPYVVDLKDMTQSRGGGGGARRRVMRQVHLRPEREQRMMEQMSLAELRQYIGSIAEFLPIHYDALLRLHEEDKVVVHASKAALQQMLVDTFADVMNQVTEGVTFPCFCSECFVCLEDYVGEDRLMHLPCGHFFHERCATDYFANYSKLCPICKEPIA